MPDIRRFGHVNVVCVIVLACVGGKRGKWGGGGRQQGLGKGPKLGWLTMSMGPAMVEVCSHVQGATIPSEQVIYTINI